MKARTNVGTTPRKTLTPTQKEKLYDLQGGICPLCNTFMVPGSRLTDEHLEALGLGGTNAMDNRAIVHTPCAQAKTYGSEGDLATIAKSKRQKRKSLGFRPESRIKSAPFPASQPRRTASTPVDKLKLGTDRP